MARHLKDHQTWLNGAAGLRSQRTTFRGRDSGDLLEAITVSLIYLCLFKLLLGARMNTLPSRAPNEAMLLHQKKKMQRYNHPSRAMLAQSEAEEEYKAIPSPINSCKPLLSLPFSTNLPPSRRQRKTRINSQSNPAKNTSQSIIIKNTQPPPLHIGRETYLPSC